MGNKNSAKEKSAKIEDCLLKFKITRGFYLSLPYEKNYIAKGEGLRFHPREKVWYTWNYASAFNLLKNKDIQPKQDVKNFFDFWGKDVWRYIKGIRYGLFLLKHKCDFASQKDNKGFSQADKKAGWDLFGKREKWNQRDIVVGAWLVYKYRNQLRPYIRKILMKSKAESKANLKPQKLSATATFQQTDRNA